MMTKRTPKWVLPAFCLFLGLASFVAFWIGGNPGEGLFGLGLLGGLGLVAALGGRSETIRGLRGDGRDEYWAGLDRDAALFAGNVAIALLIGMSMWEWAHGRDGSPYSQLGGITGLVYIAALVWLRVRR